MNLKFREIVGGFKSADKYQKADLSSSCLGRRVRKIEKLVTCRNDKQVAMFTTSSFSVISLFFTVFCFYLSSKKKDKTWVGCGYRQNADFYLTCDYHKKPFTHHQFHFCNCNSNLYLSQEECTSAINHSNPCLLYSRLKLNGIEYITEYGNYNYPNLKTCNYDYRKTCNGMMLDKCFKPNDEYNFSNANILLVDNDIQKVKHIKKTKLLDCYNSKFLYSRKEICNLEFQHCKRIDKNKIYGRYGCLSLFFFFFFLILLIQSLCLYNLI